MPKSKYTNHKGRSRRFTSQDELEEQRKKDEIARRRKAERADESSEEEEEEQEKDENSESGSESESDGEPSKPKGVENLIEVENPNRTQKKTKKLATLNEALVKEGPAKPELSRREREELEKQRATAHYMKLHAEGKTEEARADLARLAIIKQQREEAAKRREKEKMEKEAAKQSKTQQTQKALGKRT